MNQIDTDLGLGVLPNESLHTLGNLRRHQLVQFLTQFGHVLIVVRSIDNHLPHVRGIALDLHDLTRLCKDRLFRVVGKDDYQRRRRAQFHFIGKTSLTHTDGVNAINNAISTIHPELTHVHIAQATFQPELVAIDATR